MRAPLWPRHVINPNRQLCAHAHAQCQRLCAVVPLQYLPIRSVYCAIYCVVAAAFIVLLKII